MTAKQGNYYMARCRTIFKGGMPSYPRSSTTSLIWGGQDCTAVIPTGGGSGSPERALGPVVLSVLDELLSHLSPSTLQLHLHHLYLTTYLLRCTSQGELCQRRSRCLPGSRNGAAFHHSGRRRASPSLGDVQDSLFNSRKTLDCLVAGNLERAILEDADVTCHFETDAQWL